MAIDGGEIKNFLISGRDALVIIREGKLTIVHKDELLTSDIDPEKAPKPLQFSRSLTDYKTFTDLVAEQKADVMASHLLLYKGELQVSGDSSAEVDKRRVLVAFPDGRFGLVDFKPHLTLYEVAYILQQAGAESAVNLDTGYYDYSSIYTATGEKIPLGMADLDGINNKFIFLSE